MKKIFLRISVLILIAAIVLPAFSCGDSDAEVKPEPAPIGEIKLDAGYFPIAVEDGVYDYEVTVPLGNPRIPVVSVDVENAEIKQDSCVRSSGTAAASIEFTSAASGEEKKYQYSITFVQGGSESEYQYGDNLPFVPDYELKAGEKFQYESSDIFTVYIEDNGYFLTRKLSSEPVTLTAKVNGAVVDTLVINRIVPAQSLYFIMAGGPNATLDYGDVTEADKPLEGVLYTSNSFNSGVKKCLKCGGFLPSFAKTWNGSTGEKVIANVIAVCNSKMEEWLTGSENLKAAVEGLKTGFEKIEADGSEYEIRRFGLCYLGGENDHGADAAEYADMILGIIDAFEELRPFDFCAIVPCRSSRSNERSYDTLLVQLDGPRVAAFSLHNYRDNIFIGSLAAEEANISNGLAAKDNLLLSQTGYNVLGRDIAENTLARMFGTETAVASIVVLGVKGKALASGDSVTPDGKSVAAYTLPLSAGEKISVTASGDGISVSKTGIINVSASTRGGSVEYKAGDFSISLSLGEYTIKAEQAVTDPLASLSLREKAIYTMNEMATFLWKPAYNVKHSGADYVSQAFTTQAGLPYGSNRGTLEEFKKLIVDGIYLGSSVSTVDNNCTSALAQALAVADPKISYMLSDAVDQISSYLSPLYTGYGVSKLGDYEVTIPADRDEFNVKTQSITEGNGKQKMYDCYALLEPGDYVMMRKYTKNSHCRLVVSNEVTRDANGKVTGGTITVIEQGAGLALRNGGYSSFSTASKVKYSDLYEGYYVPMTLDVYHK